MTNRTGSTLLRKALGTVAAGLALAPMAAVLTASPAQAAPFGTIAVQDGVLVITGTDGANEIFIGESATTPTTPIFADTKQPLVNGSGCTPTSKQGWPAKTYTCTGYTSIRVHLGAGDDSFGLTKSTSLPITVRGDDGADIISGSSAADVLDGGNGNDVLQAGDGNDEYLGGTGDDVLVAGPGADRFSGGAGRDQVTYDIQYRQVFTTPPPGVRVTMDGAADDGAAGEGDNVLADVEDVVGGWGPDRLIAPTGSSSPFAIGIPNHLEGGAGDDLLSGGSGNDDLQGGAGQDRTVGGAGTDTCVGEVEETCEL